MIQSRMKYIKKAENSFIHSIVNGQSAYISHMEEIAIYSSIICRKCKNAKLKIASKKFFTTEYAMAFKKCFDGDFKRKINKL